MSPSCAFRVCAPSTGRCDDDIELLVEILTGPAPGRDGGLVPLATTLPCGTTLFLTPQAFGRRHRRPCEAEVPRQPEASAPAPHEACALGEPSAAPPFRVRGMYLSLRAGTYGCAVDEATSTFELERLLRCRFREKGETRVRIPPWSNDADLLPNGLWFKRIRARPLAL